MIALRAARPVDYDSALATAMAVLADKPDEAFQFDKWYTKNGVALVKIINDGR